MALQTHKLYEVYGTGGQSNSNLLHQGGIFPFALTMELSIKK